MDFVQTMKDWKRMCNAMGQEDEYTACDKCDLRDFGCPAIYEKECDSADWKHVENVVAKWAAANPEPVYPTWVEWLSKQGFAELKEGQFVKQSKNEYTYECKTVVVLTDKAAVPIPADIAQKLGLQTKENI